MSSRVDKYYDKQEVIGSRLSRNEELYKDINKSELDHFELKSNATVIGESQKSIDVEKIKSILDTHYKDVPKRRTIRLEEEPKKEITKPIFETKEYDINVILNKAKEDKEDDYNKERAKKLRDTQYDILNNLNLNDYIEDYEKEDAPQKSNNEDLQRLIDTITLNEKEVKEASLLLPDDSDDTNTNPLDIFEDLKGSENTQTLTGLKEQTEELSKTINDLEKSFFTQSNKIEQEDFEDFEDIDKDKMSFGVILLICILVLIFLVGLFILLKSFL